MLYVCVPRTAEELFGLIASLPACVVSFPSSNLMMSHSASVKERGQLWLDRSHRDPGSLILPLAAWY